MQSKVIYLSGGTVHRETAINAWLKQGWTLVAVANDYAYFVK